MGSSLTRDRVRSDIDVLSRAGLDIATFAEEMMGSLQRAVPHVAACVGTMDPATRVLTGTLKFGDLYGRDEKDDEWGFVEYGLDDPTAFRALADRDVPALGVAVEAGGDRSVNPRMRDLIRPYYGYDDELRLAGRDGTRLWGGLAIFRGADDAPFTPDEVAYVATLSASYAAGLRAGLLVRLAGHADRGLDRGPAVAIVDADNRIRQLSVGAAEILDDIAQLPHMAPASGTIASLVINARRYLRGDLDALPRARVRLPSGRWLVLHASPLSGVDGPDGDVVVTMEEARPPEIIPLVVEAFQLTERERDVTQLVLQGVDTKDIASTLHLSRYTVQDHLKSVFDKAGVRSRRELTSRVYFDQYVPRMGGDLAPSGWFAATATTDAEPIAATAHPITEPDLPDAP